MAEVSIRKALFGGTIDFAIYDAPKELVKGVVEEVYSEGLRLQKIFNFYDNTSELSILNKERKKQVSNELLEVIKKALKFSEITDGTYDISLGKSILLKKQGKISELKCSYKDIKIRENEVHLTNPEVMIDLGSIAKGYITDKLAELMNELGVEEFLIDARGDICVKGKSNHILGIQNPRNEENLFFIKLKNQAVATSGDYNQYVGNYETSHIINQKEIISVTVIAKTTEEADAYATAIFTALPKNRKKITNSNKNIKVLIVDNTGNINMLNDFEELIHSEEK